MRLETFGALEENLLVALDEMLSFKSTTTIDAFITEDAIDDFDAMRQLDILLWANENATSDSKSVAAKPSTLNRSGGKNRPTEMSSLKGKDVRSAPYSKMNKRCRRKRPKDELTCLRAKVADMEEELQFLQTKPKSGSPAAVSAAESGCSQDVLKWKRIAEQQKEEAERSLSENLRLRIMLTGQMNVARAAIEQHQREAFLYSVVGTGMAAIH